MVVNKKATSASASQVAVITKLPPSTDVLPAASTLTSLDKARIGAYPPSSPLRGAGIPTYTKKVALRIHKK